MEERFLTACKACHRQFDVTGFRQGEKIRCVCGFVIEVPPPPSREARTLHCSACGGKIRGSSPTCTYCGSEVALADRRMGLACPECFVRLPEGARYCAECGVEIRPEALRTIRASAACPRCKGQLVLRELARGQFTECINCAGIWLDSTVFDRVLEERDAEALGQIVTLARPAVAVGDVEGSPVRYLSCPTCGEIMHRKNFAGCSGVVLDWCKGHGFWFDAEEMEKVLAFIRSGGLDKARRIEIDRSKKEIERLEAKKRSIAMTPVSTCSRGMAQGGWGNLLGDAIGRLFFG
jgi:Zn-finger nucleic acid-binding protein